MRVMRHVQLQRAIGLTCSLKDDGSNGKKTMPNRSRHEEPSLKSMSTTLLKSGCRIEVRHVSQQGVDTQSIAATMTSRETQVGRQVGRMLGLEPRWLRIHV